MSEGNKTPIEARLEAESYKPHKTLPLVLARELRHELGCTDFTLSPEDKSLVVNTLFLLLGERPCEFILCCDLTTTTYKTSASHQAENQEKTNRRVTFNAEYSCASVFHATSVSIGILSSCVFTVNLAQATMTIWQKEPLP